MLFLINGNLGLDYSFCINIKVGILTVKIVNVIQT